MSETKFTKGQWSVKSQGELHFHVCVLSKGVSVYSSIKAVNDAIFDAYLIAAAPELYAILDKILNSTQPASDFYAEAEQLLAKARGEA